MRETEQERARDMHTEGEGESARDREIERALQCLSLELPLNVGGNEMGGHSAFPCSLGAKLRAFVCTGSLEGYQSTWSITYNNEAVLHT